MDIKNILLNPKKIIFTYRKNILYIQQAGSTSVEVLSAKYLSFAIVLPQYRRRGMQIKFLRLKIESARKLGVKRIFADAEEYFAENTNPSYWNILRHGFRLLYHRPNYIKE